MAADAWEWLSLIDTEGPFLSRPALKSFYPTGLPSNASLDDLNATFVAEFARWSSAWTTPSPGVYAKARDRWVESVLRTSLEWADDLALGPAGIAAYSPDKSVSVAAWAALNGADGPAALVTVVDRTENLRTVGSDGWSADAIDRMSLLLRESGVTIGIVTDGRWWALVSADKDVTTASGVWDALLWRGEERQSRDAFFALANYSSIAGGAAEKRLPLLFKESVASAEQITEALGDQVRRAVELLLQSMSDTHLRALAAGEDSPLPSDPQVVYEAAVTVLMRIVFLLFAEERLLLPDHDLYRSSYAIAGIRKELQQEATETSEEALDHTWETWHRLLAASNAVFGGASFEDMRMPAYGGSLFDAARFPWLQATDSQGRLRVRVTDRTMLAVLRAVQTIEDGAMQLSFRELDVEQIGYVYEGLLGYSAEFVDQVVVGLKGKSGFEPEIPLVELETIAADSATSAEFGTNLIAHLKKTQENSKPATPNQLAKAYGANDPDAAADARTRLRHALLGDDELAARLEPFHGIIRDDLRGFPYVVPADGLVMTESPQRSNTGTHYTPRSLAEEVVLYALEPLVYSPGPLDTENSADWVLKSSAEILDLKVADIAVGSGAFLVAAARYLSARLLEARRREGIDDSQQEDLERWAVREIVARCLYGADINGMAVEMCKLSLWLISMDPGKPFSFVDDRVFHGNSLLGVTTEAQLRAQHILPERRERATPLLRFDIDRQLSSASMIRREIASGQVDDNDRMRSTRAKRALLSQAETATEALRQVADGVVSAGLLSGGRAGRALDSQYDLLLEALMEAFPLTGLSPDRSALESIITRGLTPLVDIGTKRWKPLHWILEAPEAIRDHGGFDSIVGNPPFLAGKKISIANGSNVEGWLKVDRDGAKGAADLSAHFVRKAWNLLRAGGTLGLITTDRVGQGDTAAFSTRLIELSGEIVRARSKFAWPGKAATDAAILWAVKERLVPESVPRILDGMVVPGISASLTSRSTIDVTIANRIELPFVAGSGVGLYGEGFILEQTDALSLNLSLAERKFLRPYINGQSLMSGTPSGRVAIDLGQFANESELLAAAPVLADHVRRTVKPVRDAVTSQLHESRYWAYWDKREALFRALSQLDKFIYLAGDTRVPAFLFSKEHDAVFSHKVLLIASSDPAVLGTLSSAAHTAWFEMMRTGRGTTSGYVLSRVLRTFAFPTLTSDLRRASENFIEVRDRALELYVSPTKVYNHIDDPQNLTTEISALRIAQEALDQTVLDAYGWNDLKPEYQFTPIAGVRRYSPDGQFRNEIRRRLLDENFRQSAIRPERATSLEDNQQPEGAMF